MRLRVGSVARGGCRKKVMPLTCPHALPKARLKNGARHRGLWARDRVQRRMAAGWVMGRGACVKRRRWRGTAGKRRGRRRRRAVGALLGLKKSSLMVRTEKGMDAAQNVGSQGQHRKRVRRAVGKPSVYAGKRRGSARKRDAARERSARDATKRGKLAVGGRKKAPDLGTPTAAVQRMSLCLIPAGLMGDRGRHSWEAFQALLPRQWRRSCGRGPCFR